MHALHSSSSILPGKEKVTRLKAEERRRRAAAAVRIQANYRAHLYRWRYIAMRDLVVRSIFRMQKISRGRAARRYFLAARAAATRIAASVRGWQQRMRYLALVALRRVSSTLIQVCCCSPACVPLRAADRLTTL
jgi:hypothetical protein